MTKYYVRSVSLKHLFTLVCVIVYAIIFRLRKHEGLRKKICKLLWEGKHCAQTLEHEILIWFHDTYVRNCCYFRRLYPIVWSYMSYQGYFHFYIQKHCSIQILRLLNEDITSPFYFICWISYHRNHILYLYFIHCIKRCSTSY